MEFSLTSYRSLGHTCAAAHRVAIETGDKTAATNLFALLWTHLDREDALDRWDCQSEFNHAFGRAYRGQTDAPAPALTVPYREDDTPAPAPAPVYSNVLQRIHDTDFHSPAPAPRKSVSADCAAFYAKAGGA